MSSLLFVYGSLKHGGKLHHELAAPEARYLGRARIQGELFYIKGESWAGAFPAESQSYIQGELYKLDKPSEMLKRLDRIEGCHQGLFVRKLVDAWAGSRRVKAWAYFCNHPEKKAAQIANGNFPTE
jgi:gamma-glutamylcyclotransferase (GGCT)/AIG2-like uncharacterized protein YtfP